METKEMKKIQLKVGSYYRLFKPPGIAIKIMEITDKKYKISLLLKTELSLSKSGFDNLINNNEIKEITKEEAELTAFSYVL